MNNEKSIEYMKGYNEGYDKASEDFKNIREKLNKIIRSKDGYPYLSGDDYGNLIHQICEEFDIEEPK